LERTDYANLSSDALPVINQVEEQFERIKAFLEENELCSFRYKQLQTRELLNI